MLKIVAIALVTTTLAAFPAALPSFAADTRIDNLCGPDAPEAYKRPGGYCEQLGNNKSLGNEVCSFDWSLVPTAYDMKSGKIELLASNTCDVELTA